MDQQLLFKTLFNKNESDTDSNSFLKDSINEFPYFGLAHFYALKQTTSKESNYSEMAARTNLFFNNPYFLQAQLLSDKQTKNEPLEELNLPLITKKEGNTNEEIIESNLPIVNTFIEPDKIINEDILPIVNISDEKHFEQIIANNTFIQTEDKKLILENTTPKEELLFEPLHASDYFASQGIKLSDNALGNDKLGLQLKSFTSWLKTMKKVHPDKLPMVNEMVEKAVQNQAAKSNIEAEIVTEAMAEAFVLQDKQIRAIEVYEKLSLINPSKSAYFAAKIDQLKK